MREVTGRLTWKQICERYPGEWVVLVETDWGDDTDFERCTSIVVGHFKSRREASPHIETAAQRYTEVGSFWTGAVRSSAPPFASV